MRILVVNKFFRVVGGSERYMFECAELLKSKGHEVAFFSMQDERNLPSEFDKYFVSNIEYAGTRFGYRIRNLARTVAKTVYSLESKRKIASLIRDTKPDIAHLHMISHQISPSILHTLRAMNVPVVQTTHEYKLICPNYRLYLDREAKVCERCLGGKYYRAGVNRCLKDSLLASSLACFAMYLHKAMRIYERNVDLFLAPSNFLAKKLVEAGVPSEKVRYLPYYIDIESYEPNYAPSAYAICYGRLAPEKGLMTLLRAASIVPELDLVIAGEGPEKEKLEKQVSEQQIGNVRFVGYKQGDELRNLVRDASFVVLPSEWYENSPLVTYEAFAMGKPVIASRIGGIPELVDERETGLLFEPGKAEELAKKMRHLAGSPELCLDMGRRGRKKVQRLCASHYGKLTGFYEEAMRRRAQEEGAGAP